MRFIALLACLIAPAAQAQIFSVLPGEPPIAPAWSVPGPRPVKSAILNVDNGALDALLAKAPVARLDASLDAYGLRISLPNPAGQLIPCMIAESPVMEAPLAQRFPGIKTYIVQSVDGSAVGRIEKTQRGLTGMLRTDSTAWMIDQWQSGDAEHVVSYYLRDLPTGGEWTCHTQPGVHGFGALEQEDAHDHEHEHAPRGGGGDDGSGGTRALQILRTFRTAIACTGEYGVYHSQIQGHEPNAADPLAAIVTVLGRVNVIYEAELGVHFNLVANNDLIIYFNPMTDPYPTTCDGSGGADCSGNLLTVNNNLLPARIGNSNFDIGHVLTRVVGGVAYLSGVCTSNKAGGVSGIPRGGDIDPFSALIVIHEMGHQFGANHTFSGVYGRCAGNVNLSTAWEAGSGSSPMAYAGACPVGGAPPSDNVVLFADPYFHHGSLGEMFAFIGTRTCDVETTTANNIPVIQSVTPFHFIPPGTPFVLSAFASDADSDPLTYSWEQFDNGVARPIIGGVDNGLGALFRAFPPVSSAQRTFPRMADILSGVPTPGERLPTAVGTRRFRVSVRDNRAGGGGIAISQFVSLTIPPNVTPFAVTAPAQGVVLHAGLNAVAWTVGNTNIAPVSCSSVTIRLSTDNGVTFAENLGSFPNSGSATVTLPPVTSNARIRVDADEKIFFSISRPFAIQAPCAADFNYDDIADSQDFFDFLTAFFELSPSSDFNHDGALNSQDFFDYINIFFAGC